MNKVDLEIVALSHSITQSQSYAIVLGESKGVRRLPIVIGSNEAQAIAVALEKMDPVRPLTHDLMKNIILTFGYTLKEVLINNLKDGVFYSQLICIQGSEIFEIDSRTSDAIALAVRFNCPIYTYEFILDSAGIEMDVPGVSPSIPDDQEVLTPKKSPSAGDDITQLSIAELNQLMDKLVESEDFENAAKVRDELNRRTS